MKIYELLFILGILAIILSVAIYGFSLILVPNSDDHSITDLLGATTEIDSTISTADALSDFTAKQRHHKMIFLSIGILLGIVIFSSGIFVKRKTEGPDLFIDDDLDEEAD